jgi:hypothetical protein
MKPSNSGTFGEMISRIKTKEKPKITIMVDELTPKD